jgi:hypothetical protein
MPLKLPLAQMEEPAAAFISVGSFFNLNNQSIMHTYVFKNLDISLLHFPLCRRFVKAEARHWDLAGVGRL